LGIYGYAYCRNLVSQPAIAIEEIESVLRVHEPICIRLDYSVGVIISQTLHGGVVVGIKEPSIRPPEWISARTTD